MPIQETKKALILYGMLHSTRVDEYISRKYHFKFQIYVECFQHPKLPTPIKYLQKRTNKENNTQHHHHLQQKKETVKMALIDGDNNISSIFSINIPRFAFMKMNSFCSCDGLT